MPTWSTIITLVVASIAAMSARIEANPINSDYLSQREQLISEDRQRRVGARLSLTPEEKIVSDIFVQEKSKLIETSRRNRTVYFPAASFFLSKPQIENSTLFKLIQQMPKGAILHVHDSSVVSLDWFVKNATYRENVYMCVDQDGYIILGVFKVPPLNRACPWMSVRAEREASGDADLFDQRLKTNLSLLATDPLTTYADNAQIWIRFLKSFAQTENLIAYAPIYKDYLWRMLVELRENNVQYIELRASLTGLYELDGTMYNDEYAVQLFKNVTSEFVNTYPDFNEGAKKIAYVTDTMPSSGVKESK